jgi:hypothetical protein
MTDTLATCFAIASTKCSNVPATGSVSIGFTGLSSCSRSRRRWTVVRNRAGYAATGPELVRLGVCVRTVAVWHITWSVNSLSTFGLS